MECLFCKTILTAENRIDLSEKERIKPIDTRFKVQSCLKEIAICKYCYDKKSKNLKLYSLKKEEILSSKKAIQSIMDKGQRFFKFPFRVVFQINDLASDQLPLQILFSVPKRRFKLAVDRNLLRRRMKEAYRLNNHHLKQQLLEHNKMMSVVVIYSHSERLDYKDIEQKIKESLLLLENELTTSK